MSYEGYVQNICKNGHYFSSSDSWGSEHDETCECGSAAAWKNSVDDTNGQSYGEIPDGILRKFYMRTDDVVKVCDLGHRHVVQERTFRIPGEEAQDLRHLRPDSNDDWRPFHPRRFLDRLDQLEAGTVFGKEPEA